MKLTRVDYTPNRILAHWNDEIKRKSLERQNATLHKGAFPNGCRRVRAFKGWENAWVEVEGIRLGFMIISQDEMEKAILNEKYPLHGYPSYISYNAECDQLTLYPIPRGDFDVVVP